MISLIVIVKMENSVSTPLCSLIVYLNQETEPGVLFLQDVRSFFNKFPLHYEVVFIIEPNKKNPLTKHPETFGKTPAKEKITIIQNTTSLKRAESLRRGFDQAQGEYLLVADVSMTTPLGDLFKILQHLMAEEELDICWGERYSKKTNTLAFSQTPRHSLENLFNRIFQEKLNLKNADILCEIYGIKKKSWLKINSKVPRQPGWYLGPALRRSCQLHPTTTRDVAIHDSGKISHSYSLWRERWNLFKLSLKGL